MTLPEATRDRIADVVGAHVKAASAVRGGDINDAFRVELSDGRLGFLKVSPRAPDGMYAAEARSLGWLRESRTLRVPEVLAIGNGAGCLAFLLLEWIERGRPARNHDEVLGRGLAALHRFGHGSYRGPADRGFLATMATDDRESPTAAAFFGERRLRPLLSLCQSKHRAPTRLVRGIEAVCDRIDELAGPPEPPARLHGDLWGGNAMTDERGAPCLVDPAAFAGHREIDLAMMRLFGGFSERTFAAYAEAHPLAEGHAERVGLWQLAPLLAHVAMFGQGYVGQVASVLDALGV